MNEEKYQISIQQVNNANFNDQNWGPCNMSKERIIFAKPTFLTPKSASRLFGKFSNESLPPIKSQNSLNSNTSFFNPSEDSHGFSDSEVSNASEATFGDTLSILSDTVFVENENVAESFPSDTDSFFENKAISGSLLQDSVDRSSELSSYSFSSSVSQETPSTRNYLQSNISKESVLYEQQIQSYKKEIEDLKNCLKISQADTAILVSSKQQLQLNNLDLNELNKSLRQELNKQKELLAENGVKIASLKRSNSLMEKKSSEMVEILKNDLKDIKNKFDATSIKLDDATVEKDQLENKLAEKSHRHNEMMMKNKKLEEEVNKLLSKCVKLELLASQVNENSCGNSEYINEIRKERDDYAKKLHSQEQETVNQQLLISKLENRLSQLNIEHSSLASTRSSLLQTLKEKEVAIANLNSQLAAKNNEKQLLDNAISRLQEDLFHVESSFTKIKQEMTQKSIASQQETAIKKHFESQISLLKSDLELVRKDSLNFSQKIRDKNNQLVQLSEQLKRAFLAKRKSDSEIKALKFQLSERQQSLTDATKQENQLKRLLEEKSQLLRDKDTSIQSNLNLIEDLKSKVKEGERLTEQQSSQLNSNQLRISALEEELKCVQQKLNDSLSLLNNKEASLAELQQQVEHDVVSRSSLVNQVDKLTNELKKSQQTNDSRDPETSEETSHIISQLQASRRDLFERNARLEQEKSAMLDQNESFCKEKMDLKLHEAELKKEVIALNARNSHLEEQLNKFTNDLKLAETNQSTSAGKLLHLSQECDDLKSELADAKTLLNQHKNDLSLKEREITSLSNTNKILNEELETAKKEMNSTNLRLVEVLKTQRRNDKDEEKADLFERLQALRMERDKLKEAVVQQQRYIDTLQVHYQKWSSDVAIKFQQLQTESSCSVSLQDASCQTSHEEKQLPSSPVLPPEINSVQLTNSSTQTIHDEKPLTASPFKGPVFVNGQVCSKCGKSMINRLRKEDCSFSPSDSLSMQFRHESNPESPKKLPVSEETTSGEDKVESKSRLDFACQVTGVVGVVSRCDAATEAVVHVASCSTQTDFGGTNPLDRSHSNYLEAGGLSPPASQLEKKPFVSFSGVASASTQTVCFVVDSSQQTDTESTNVRGRVAVDHAFAQTDSIFDDINTSTHKRLTRECSCQTESPDVAAESTRIACFDAFTQTQKTPSDYRVSETRFTQTDTVDKQDKSTSSACMMQASLTHSQPHLVSFSPYDMQKMGCQTELTDDEVERSHALTQTDLSGADFSQFLHAIAETNVEKLSENPNSSLIADTDATLLLRNAALTSNDDLSPRESLRSAFTQTDLSSNCLPSFPDPRTFLDHVSGEDRAKLKAYKQTVKVLRSKLKQAEQQLTISREACKALQVEVDALKLEAQSSQLVQSSLEPTPDKSSEEDVKLIEELSYWKDNSEQREKLIGSLQNEIAEIKKRHRKDKEAIQRKAKASRLLTDKKMKQMSDRLDVLVTANERLRTSVSKLQVKLTGCSRDLETCQRDKLRYQHRARKLQSDLRSLSWLATAPTKDEKIAPENEVLPANESSTIELPSSVLEIDSILKDLRKEIGVLEEHLHHHSSEVNRSKASLRGLRGNEKLNKGTTSAAQPR